MHFPVKALVYPKLFPYEVNHLGIASLSMRITMLKVSIFLNVHSHLAYIVESPKKPILVPIKQFP